MDENILEILRCPVSGSVLKNAERSLLERLNQKIASGKLTDLSGKPVESQFEGLLINESETIGLPVRSGVVSMTSERAISLESFDQESE